MQRNQSLLMADVASRSCSPMTTTVTTIFKNGSSRERIMETTVSLLGTAQSELGSLIKRPAYRKLRAGRVSWSISTGRCRKRGKLVDGQADESILFLETASPRQLSCKGRLIDVQPRAPCQFRRPALRHTLYARSDGGVRNSALQIPIGKCVKPGVGVQPEVLPSLIADSETKGKSCNSKRRVCDRVSSALRSSRSV
jgi:hypothetical protein